jgi:hypothetical protein
MNVAIYLSCYFQHHASPGPVLEEILPAVVVLVEHPASPCPLLEESLPAVVVLVEHPASPCLLLEESLPAVVVLVEHPASPCPLLEESLPAVVVFVEQLTLTDHKLKALIGWIHHTRDDQLDECHCGMPPYLTQSVHFHHVVLLSPGHFASGWSFAFLTSNFVVEILCFGGFRSLFGGYILFGSWMALIFFFEFL